MSYSVSTISPQTFKRMYILEVTEEPDLENKIGVIMENQECASAYAISALFTDTAAFGTAANALGFSEFEIDDVIALYNE
jgi:hypothetical protein